MSSNVGRLLHHCREDRRGSRMYPLSSNPGRTSTKNGIRPVRSCRHCKRPGFGICPWMYFANWRGDFPSSPDRIRETVLGVVHNREVQEASPRLTASPHILVRHEHRLLDPLALRDSLRDKTQYQASASPIIKLLSVILVDPWRSNLEATPSHRTKA